MVICRFFCKIAAVLHLVFIHLTLIGTIHDHLLVVFIVVQNLVGVDAVVLII